MPVVMRVLDPERSHTFAVWLASKDLVPMDTTGDPEILVNENLKQQKSRQVLSKLFLEIYFLSCSQGLYPFWTKKGHVHAFFKTYLQYHDLCV